MDQKYFSKNTDNFKFTLNIANFPSISVKKKQYKIQFIIPLSLLMMFLFAGNTFAQTTLFSSGFETSDATFTSSAGTNTIITQPNTDNQKTGINSGKMVANADNTSFTGSIITSNRISFIAGRYYTVSVWAKAAGDVSFLKIKKSVNATNADMIAATGTDVILTSSSANVTTTSYVQFSATIMASATENKFVGIQVISGAQGNRLSTVYIDDISIVENTSFPITYCTPSVSSGLETTRYISKISFIGTLNDVTNTSTFSSTTPGYEDFSNLSNKAIQAQGEGINVFFQSPNSQNIVAWVDWNKDGDFYDTGEQVYSCDASGSTIYTASTTFGFIIPPTTASGDYRIRIRCVAYNSTLAATPCGNINTYGETEDYLFTVISSCSATITSITNGFNCGTGSVTLGITGSAGSTQYRWYDAQTGGTLVGTTASTTWPTPSITATTTYFVTALNGSCESLFRTPVVATIKPVPTLTFPNANPEVCGENSIISLQVTGSNEQVYLIDENFESGSLGAFSNYNIISNSASIDNSSSWQIKSSTFVPGYPPFYVWFPAISSGFGTNKFAMAASDVGGSSIHNELRSTNINASNFLNLKLSLRIYFSRYTPDDTSTLSEFVAIEISDNNGAWTTINPNYTTDLGIGTRFDSKTYDLNSYAGKSNLRVRIRYYANGWFDGVAIDDIKLFGDRPLSPSFQWTSALPIDAYTNAACTLPYTAGTPASIVYVKPTLAQLEQSTYSFTAKANLANSCSTSAIINVTNKSKVWQNSTTDWNNTSNWKPVGVPTADNCVIIPSTTIIPIIPNPGALAKNLTVKSTGNLELSTGSSLTVTDWINVNTSGVFNIRDKASLIQINNVANTGIVNIERVTPPISKLDYTYWGSPVTLGSNFSLGSLSPNSPLMFSWKPTVGGGAGNWQNETIATIMDPRKGYIVRAPNSFSSSIKTPYTATFAGTPNNGDIFAPISKGTLIGTTDVDAENDEWNLIGNPYPSALDAAKFLNLAVNTSVIDGTLYLWTHNSQPNAATIDPFYGDYVLNYTDTDYAVFNTTGGTATAPASTGGFAPTGYIASGQSFFVKAANNMINGTTANVTFNNSMRISGQNSNFFKLTKNNNEEAIPKTVTDIERHRIWINLTNNSGAFSQTLVGYIQDATQGLDRSFDGESLGGNDVSFYSIIPEAELTIQGRALPFDENDQITLGYDSEISGELSIRIDHIDGLFNTQNIYLEDKELSVIHNLKEKPYVFNTEKGTFNDRFYLRFTDKTLGTDTFNLSKSDGVIVVVNQNVTVQSSNQLIKNIVVYDLLGRKIDNYKKVNALKYTLSHLNKTTAGLIVKITLDNDTVVSKKIIY
ncbi:GEVED domain-containing protein [Flavobacterium xueshanense]|uniref:Uncharacterized protein n=1 Tax=Flavobacterium xueshanense TaxID=935223 RepID=A0A1I1YQK1_9FLAO|nr:GEVED domain-containing protein [Flavobacterium xueshanense]SFE21592.1 hypothetical protein SAMN04488131_10182 [Flavobacterium xueshanense]